MIAVLRQVVGLLVEEDYEGIERLSGSKRSTAAEMRSAVRQYPGKLVFPPDNAFSKCNIYEVDGSMPQSCRVDFDLWTDREGESDLTLQVSIVEGAGNSYVVEIDGIHVL